ncbi:cytokinesis regulator [Xylaria digitata]|nr:cytokinesis regulator [Xylaria digitata]
MEPLRLKPRKPVEEMVENWDDDDFMIGDDDDLTFRSNSASTTTRNTSNSRRRESRSSFRSDRESLPGDERQVHLPGDDEKSTLDAIAAATHAGIPIPTNVPPSALMGGTIKRLGGRKIKKIFQEDWGDELELPAPGQALRLKAQDGNKFPEVLRQVSGSTNPSPAKKSLLTLAQLSPPQSKQHSGSLGAPINLEKFRDTEDDDDIFGDGSATIKASKLQVRGRPISLITPPTPSPPKRKSKGAEEDDFEIDLELPSDGKLKLSSRRDIPKTPALNINDDFDWGEGSLGTRFGGTRRDAFSNRSSSVSAMSPSIASSFTVESEDEFFDGLVLPMGPLDLGERLKLRKQSRSPQRPDPKNRALQVNKDEEDLVSGLDFGEGNVFRYAKPTVHRNVRVKEARPTSPARPKAAVSITFTNKPVNTGSSRIPRPMVSHERSHTQSSLEPVSESGGPIPQKPARRPQSRLSGHSAHSSISSIHTPTTPSSVQSNFPPTPRRRELCQKTSTGTLRTEPTTTSAQLLRLKRSLPAMRHNQSPAKPTTTRSDRPPSRGDSRADLYRPQSSLRPKTPVERSRSTYESSAAQARKSQAPFLPAGASQSQSHHVNAKGSRSLRRNDFDQGAEVRPLSRAFSRSAIRSPSPRRSKNEKSTPEPAWQQINKPRRVRHFGDGHELDAFDDLPTSAQTESRYIKQPIASGNKSNIRNKIYQNVLPDRNTPSPVSPYSPNRMDLLPRFARDTAASRIARETSLAQRAQPTAPLAPLTSQRVAQLSTRTNLNPHSSLNHSRSKKSRKPPQLKPHLISNLNSAKDSKVVNGMTYNPVTFRWEGNENVLNAFDVPTSSPSATPLPQPMIRDRDTATPRPVLITNINTKKEVRRMGDMVFDPQNMCWLEVKTATPSGVQSEDPMAGFAALEEEDPFKDIPDLEDKVSTNSGPGRVSDIREDWLVGEEFDVGPEFVRRQHEEEARWRRKCEKWTSKVARNRTDWRWAIRDIVMQTP